MKVDRADEDCVSGASTMLVSWPVWVDGGEYLGTFWSLDA